VDYKQQVINSADAKHQDLLNGRTEPVIRTDLNLESSSTYAENRNKFVKRTEAERKSFNDAIDVVKRNSKDRGLDRSSFGGIITTFVIFVVLIGVIFGLYFGVENMQQWLDNNILPKSGLDFSELFSGNANTLAAGICSLISGIAGIVLFIVLLCCLDIDNCLGKLIACAILSGIGSAVLLVVLQLLVFVGGYILYYLFHLYGICVLGLAAVIVMLAVGGRMISAKYKRGKWIYVLLTVAITAVSALVISM
jgi:magnesium-transporting ATPase (P-type)